MLKARVMPAPLTAQQIALYMSERRAGYHAEVATAAGSAAEAIPNQNRKYTDASHFYS